MGKGAVKDGAFYEACSECRIVCQTTHGKDLPRAVPRFFKTIVEHSTPSSTNCHLQIPASFIRNHIGLHKKGTFTLVGTQGCEWVMNFSTIGFKAGWKEFSVAYELETGDGIMLSLVAPKRFYANVFDKFGIEKFDTKKPRNRAASPASKENQVSNSMNGGGGAENESTPLESNGTHLHQEGKSNGAHHHAAGTSGQNRSHDNRILFRDAHHPFPNEPVDHETDPSSMSPSSDDSEDSIQVRLAKAVLAKAKQKKLKRKRKASCTSTLQAAEGTNTQREGAIVGVEDRADGRSNVDPTDSPLRNDETPASVDDAMFENPCEELRALTDIRTSSMVGGGIDVSNMEEVNDLLAESQTGKLLLEGEALLPQFTAAEGVVLREVESNSRAESQPIPLRGAEGNNVAEDQPILLRGVESNNPAEDQPILLRGVEGNNPAEGQHVLLRGVESNSPAESQPIPLRGAEGNNPAEGQPVLLRGVESNIPAESQPIPLRGAEGNNPAEGQPSLVFIPGLVKLEPDLSPHQTSENCNQCGLKKVVPKLDRSMTPKSEPVTTDSPGLDIRTLETRSPSSYAPRVSEFQKQRALSMATELSKAIKNPNALVVGRVSMSEPNGCFLSNMCSEMLPSVPTEFTLMDTEGNAQRVNWKPNQRIMDGPGWIDFVGSHNLHSDDFWVMEVIDSSENNVVVKAHIFRSHEMERAPERLPPAVRAAPGPAKTPAVPVAPALHPVLGTPAPVLGTGAKTRSNNQLHNPVASPSKTNKRTRASNVDESAALAAMHCTTNTTEHERTLLQLTGPSALKRPRRGSSSSPSTPRTLRGTDSSPTSGTGEERSQAAKPSKPSKPVKKAMQPAPQRRGLYTPHAQRKATTAEAAVTTTKRGGASQNAKKAQPQRSSTTGAADEPAEIPKQVRTRNSQKTHYKVSKVIDRRKSLQGVVFLVELMDRVRPESLQQKRMKAQQDEKGRWWVPHHHFNHNLSACYLE